MTVCSGLSFLSLLELNQCDVWAGDLKTCVMLRGLLLGKAWGAGEGRSGEPVMQGSVSPLMRAAQSVERRLGEDALAFGAVRGESFEDDSASCVVPVCVELGRSTGV